MGVTAVLFLVVSSVTAGNRALNLGTLKLSGLEGRVGTMSHQAWQKGKSAELLSRTSSTVTHVRTRLSDVIRLSDL